MVKRCSGCKSEKDESEFNRRKERGGSLRSDCKKCQSDRFAAYAKKNVEKFRAKSRAYHAAHPEVSHRYATNHPDKIKAKNARRDYRWVALEQKYGVTQDRFHAMLVEQDGRCAICRTDSPGGRGWNVDHDHSTGHVRGILCGLCNAGLGCFRDDVDRMTAGIDYLRRHR